MNPISAVLIGHLIGDWIIQTDWQAENKTKSWKANQQHMLSYHIALLTLISLSMPLNFVLMTLIVSWVSHSIIDRRWPVQRLMEVSQSKPFSQTTFGIIAVDQTLHLSILLLMAGLV